MSSEPIDIKIQDQVAPSISKKLDEIATKSRLGYENIERLKRALAAVQSTGVNRLALEQNKLETAIARTATAQQRQAQATANAAAAQSRAASAALRLQQQQDRLAAATNKVARDAEALKRELSPLYAAHQAYNAAVERAQNLHRQGAIDLQTYNAALSAAKAKLEATAAATRSFNAAQQAVGRTAVLNRAHLVNLGFQLNDIGVSLASGQNPLIVLAQQGSQIGGIASQAGVGLGRLAIEASKMLSRFVPIVAVIGTLVSGFKLFATEASKGANLAQFAANLGATRKEIKSLDLDVVTLGDTFRGLFRTIDDATGIGAIFNSLWENIRNGFATTLKFVANTFSSIVSLGRATVDTLVLAWQVLPNRISLFVAEMVNATATGFETLVNGVIDGTNVIITAFNAINNTSISLLDNIAVAKIDTSKFEVLGTDLSQAFVDSYLQNMAGNQQAIDEFMAKWQANSVEAARERIKEQLDDGTRDLSKGLSEINVEAKKLSTNLFDHLTPIQRMNRELAQQEQLLKALPPQREVLQQMQQIENELFSKNVILLGEEREALMRRLELQRQMNVASQAEAQVYEATRGAREQYLAQLQAIDKLRNAGVITGGESAQQIISASPGLDFSNTQTALDAQVQQYQDMYARIAELRRLDLISEQQAASMRIRVWSEQQAANLETATGFFGQLSQLQRSENSKIARIGKTAAIAKAIIDTYTAATGAYAAMSAIPVVGPALGVAAAAAAITAGMANVAAIRSQGIGFRQGGYTGDMARSAVAGAVHGQEYVMNAETTRRIGVENLDRMQRGGSAGGGINVSIQNFGTSKEFEVEQISENEIRVIARDEADKSVAKNAPRVIAAEIVNPNSKVSKSLRDSTNTGRQR